MLEHIHILVVEDDEFMRDSLVTELELAGYRVTAAQNGLEAVEQSRGQHFDLIVTDVRMPGMDGLETISAVREFQPAARTIVITGYANPQAPITAVKLKVDDYLQKPFTTEEFMKSVRTALEASLQELRRQRSTTRTRETLLEAVQQAYQRGREPEVGARFERILGAALHLARLLNFSLARTQTLQLVAWLQHVDPALLERSSELKDLAPILCSLEERWDGTGPRALVGAQIPLEARILMVGRMGAEGDKGACDPHLLELMTTQTPGELPLTHRDQGLATLLSVADAYLDMGNLEVAHKALNQAEGLLPTTADGELEVRLHRLWAGYWQRAGQNDKARLAAQEALKIARQHALDLPAAYCLLQLADLGVPPGPHDLQGARQTFALWECAREVAVCDLWLAVEALQRDEMEPVARLLAHSEAPQLLGSYRGAIEQVAHWCLLHGHLSTELQALVNSREEEGLALVESLLESSHVSVRLKALDLLAALQTPQARALLARQGSDRSGAVAQKSSWLLEASGNELVLQVNLLGPLRLIYGKQVLDEDGFATRKTRSLFTYMMARRGVMLPEEVLMELFWEGQTGPKGRHSLHNSISQIRKLLKPWLEGRVDELLVKKRGGYVMTRQPFCLVDTEEFQERLKLGRGHLAVHQTREALAELKRAEQLYKGDFLEGAAEEWAEEQRLALQNQLISLWNTLGRYFFESGKMEVSLEYWRQILARDCCNEEAYLGQILALLSLNRSSEAVKAYHLCVRKLREELNVGPPPRLLEIYLKVVDGQPVEMKI